MRKLINSLLGAPRKLDPENHPYAKVTTPDQLIAAHCVESFARNFDDWAPRNLEIGWGHYSSWNEAPRRTLTNDKDNITIEFENLRQEQERGHKYKLNPEKATVRAKGKKSVVLDAKSSRHIIESWDKIYVVKIKAKEVADKALAAMKENETKWNIAEQLLGMKRNKLGALVPANQVEEHT